MSRARLATFEEFWPYYLGEHARPATRWLHFLGTNLALSIVAAALVAPAWWMLLAAPLCGYGFAWVSHFTVEKNRPATFTYPLWSLRGDLKMLGLMWRGQLWRGTLDGRRTPGEAAA
jgi:hypothetical protein